MSVWTNWDPLEEVIVGDCHAVHALDWYVPEAKQSAFNQILEETKQDLDSLAALLQSLGVTVHRPLVPNIQQNIQLPTFSIKCAVAPVVPRDQFLVYGSTVYQTFTSMPDRYIDSLSYYKIFCSLFKKGHNWLSQPAPNLFDIPNDVDWTQQGETVYKKILHERVLWHTATMFKCGDALITNTAGPGTALGLEWMQRNLPPNTVVANYDTTQKNWGHIDHGFLMIDDNTVICLDPEFVPKVLRDKNMICVQQYLPVNQSTQPARTVLSNSLQNIHGLLDEAKGYVQVTNFDLNVLVVDSNNIIFGSYRPELFAHLKQHGITCHYSEFRHNKFWYAGIHCVTLDIKRRGQRRKIINEV